MTEFVAGIMRKKPVRVFYVRRFTVFGNEVEFRWKPYFNSRTWRVKTSYNVTDADHAEIRRLILEAMPGARIPP